MHRDAAQKGCTKTKEEQTRGQYSQSEAQHIQYIDALDAQPFTEQGQILFFPLGKTYNSFE